MKWRKLCKYTIEYKGFIYQYDTAAELAEMVKQSGSQMPNPYDPSSTEFDEFNEVLWGTSK